ncbi:MAG: winged helix-turn-helix domain-containing protein [Candidatus Methanofastidiosia archaeon]
MRLKCLFLLRAEARLLPTSLEAKMRHYRMIYEILWSQSPRISVKDISSALHIDPRTTSRRMKEAFDQGYIAGPQIRKRSYANMKEYMYFISCENPFPKYVSYSQDERVVYHARMAGFASLWIISRTPLDIKDAIVLEGYRSDYHLSYAPTHSWERAVKIMKASIETCYLNRYKPKEILKNRHNTYVQWDEEDEALHQYFKYNLRKPFSPVMRRHLITSGKIYAFLEKLPSCCTITTSYFPEGIASYDPYLFMFNTEYEDFIIDLFSQLPTSSFFFKVSDRLFLLAYVKRHLLRYDGLTMSGIGQLQIPILVKALLDKKIINSEDHAIVEYHWAKDL